MIMIPISAKIKQKYFFEILPRLTNNNVNKRVREIISDTYWDLIYQPFVTNETYFKFVGGISKRILEKKGIKIKDEDISKLLNITISDLNKYYKIFIKEYEMDFEKYKRNLPKFKNN